jgi:hypothetical protein
MEKQELYQEVAEGTDRVALQVINGQGHCLDAFSSEGTTLPEHQAKGADC